MRKIEFSFLFSNTEWSDKIGLTFEPHLKMFFDTGESQIC